MFILGSCKALNLGYSGCCIKPPSATCATIYGYCDQLCHSNNDCCSDIDDIGCYPVPFSSPIVTSTPTAILSKIKSEVYTMLKGL